MINPKVAIGAGLVGAFALGALVVAYSSAQQEDTVSRPHNADVSEIFSELEEEEIGKVIRAYLMENPEVIIEAVNEYSLRQRFADEERQRTVAAQRLSELLDENTSFVFGKSPATAKVAVVELYDYHCGFCKRATSLVRDVADKDKNVKFVMRELPILREESGYAAEMSLAARPQGKFQEFHFELMNASGVLTKDRVHDLARKVGLDVSKMEAEIAKGEIHQAIGLNQQLAQEMGAEGTPAFIIAATDGSFVEVISGYRPEDILQAIEAAKKAAG